MLEAREDDEVHINVLFRLDVFALKNRLIFVHRYFLSRILGLGTCNLDDLDQPDDIKVPEGPPERVLEEYTDVMMNDFFDEAFNILILIHSVISLHHQEA